MRRLEMWLDEPDRSKMVQPYRHGLQVKNRPSLGRVVVTVWNIGVLADNLLQIIKTKNVRASTPSPSVWENFSPSL